MPLHARRSLVLAAAVTATTAAAPPAAAADGLPIIGVDAAPISAPGGDVEYLTRRAKRDTLLEKRERGGGRVLRRLPLRGRYSVPAVAYDGSPSGLAASGRTLILITPRTAFPRRTTTLAVVDAGRLQPRRKLQLKGDFSFDALAPDGRTMYLIEYLSARDVTRYAVRAYDLRRRRLLPEPIVDPREPDERMAGLPMTRATSRDGRWEYTLYESSDHPFIHALDTERRRAFCIDLHGLEGRKRGMWGLKLELDQAGRTLTVVAGATPLARVNTRTLRVQPNSERRAAAAGGGIPWAPILLPSLLLAAAAMTVSARRRTRRRTLTASLVTATDCPSSTASSSSRTAA